MVTIRAWFWWAAQYPVYWVAYETHLWWSVRQRYVRAASAYIRQRGFLVETKTIEK